jgi:hypothetical protein
MLLHFTADWLQGPYIHRLDIFSTYILSVEIVALFPA